jgi:hypothetical protein
VTQLGVRVARNLWNGQRDLLGAPRLGQGEAVAKMHRQAAAQVRERERALPVAAVGGADQVEQSFVL